MTTFFRRHQIALGASCWLLWLLVKWPHPLQSDWGRALLLLAPFVVVPVVTKVLERQRLFSASEKLSGIQQWQLPAAVLLAFSFALQDGWLALLLAMPWACVLFGMAWIGLRQLLAGAWRSAADFSMSAGLAALAVAGFWAMLHRTGVFPLGFDPEIIFLTIVHFHYAGFVLPVLAGLATRQLRNAVLGQVLCYLTVAGVAFLAIGITLTQLGLGSDWELGSAWLMALSASGVAAVQVRLCFAKGNLLKVRLLWMASSLSLFGGMLLAGLYGSRFVAPVPWLDIPMMRALHGSLNAVGFGLLGVLAWWLEGRQRQLGSQAPASPM